MAFTVKIKTTDEQFTERFDVRRDAKLRAIEIMDAGEYVKTTRRGADIIHDVYKTTVSSPRQTLYVNMGLSTDPNKMRFDGVEGERLLKIKDDERMAARSAG